MKLELNKVIMNQLTQARQEEEEQGEMLIIILMMGLHVYCVSNIPGEPIFCCFCLSWVCFYLIA